MKAGRLWIVLNPAAGKGRAARQLPKIARLMRESGREFEIFTTEGAGDAIRIVQGLPPGEDDVTVAAGGDGTCNEVANGLLSRPAGVFGPPRLGLLPVGRGNDFAFSAGVSPNLDVAVRTLLEGREGPLDAGLVRGGFFPEGRYFVNGVGIGFDAKVGFLAARMRIKSGLSYALAAFAILARYEPSPVIRIAYDGKETTLPATLVSVVNGRRMGGVFFMGPQALLDDGLLDLCCVRHQSGRLKLLGVMKHYMRGTQAACPGVMTDRAARLLLQAPEGGMAAHCDGETVCLDGRELEISCVPAALRLVGGERRWS